MKTILLTLSTLALITTAHADQAATLTCTGKNVILKSEAPYLGENSPVSQELYVLSSVDSDGTNNKAFFLDNIEHDAGPGGTLYITGKNSVGGSFELIMSGYSDESTDVSIKYVSKGTIKYNHGPLKGSDKVSCVLE